VYKVNN